MSGRNTSKFHFLASLALGLTVVSHAEGDVALKNSSAKPAGTWTNRSNMSFVRIAAGEFMAGSPTTEPERSTNEIQHRVTITRPFWLGATHVTVGQFAAFVETSGYQTAAEKQGWAHGAWNVAENKWSRNAGSSWRNPGFEQKINNPVVCVTWHDANAFCDWLSKKEDRKYRLPTEAEWEYASRAGESTAYLWGNNPDDGQGWANCSDQTTSNLFTLFPSFNWSDGFVYTSPVATFRTNAWGLYDMLGNALQWCGDWFGDYPSAAVTDPEGPAEGGERVLRGGSFIYGPRHCRCAFRGRSPADFQNFYVGFRVLLEIDAAKPTLP